MSGTKTAMSRFDERDLPDMVTDAKVGLIATVNPEGLPHVTLITTLRVKTRDTLVWAQFIEGLSKQHVTANPKTGFLLMPRPKELLRGKALWTGRETGGEDYAAFASRPMFRYSACLGIHAVHRMDLVETFGRERLPATKITLPPLPTKKAKPSARAEDESPILKPWALALLNKQSSMKFLCSVQGDGFPFLIPLIRCRASDRALLVFSKGAYRDELMRLEKGKTVAVFGLDTDRESVLVRGVFGGFETHRNPGIGAVDINWVYNSMPPLHGPIYPEPELRRVTDL